MSAGRLKTVLKDPAWWAVFSFFVVYLLLAGIATKLSLASDGKANHYGFWALVLVGLLMLGFVVVLGFASKGRFDGVLIDRYNRITLASFQILLWTLLVVAAYSAAMLTNLMAGGDGTNALDVSIPPELWLAMGISAGSFTTSKAIKLKIPDRKIDDKADPGDARWIDMFRSDVTEGAGALDISKLQMFLFTAILVAGYGATVANKLFNATGPIDELPELNNAFITLLLISNGTYLARKGAHLIQNEK
jgi:hypothetical protein